MNIKSWNHETRQAYVGTLLYSLLEILAAILTPIAFAGGLLKAVGASSGGGFVGVLLIIVEICVIAGYVMFFLAIKDLKEITEGEDKEAFKNVWLSIIFSILAAVFGIFHVRLVSGICSLVACVLLLLGYASLRKSKTIAEFSPMAVNGFKRLFAAEIIIIAGVVIGWLPIIGGLLGAILKVVAWILVLLGWKAVATPVAEPGEAPVAEKTLVETVKEVVSESIEEAKEVAKDAGEKAKDAAKEVVDATKETAKEVSDKTKEVAENVVDKTKEVASNVAEKTKETAVNVADKTKEVAANVAEKAKDVAENVADKTKEVAEKTKDAVKEAGEKVADAAETVVDKAKDALDSIKPDKPAE